MAELTRDAWEDRRKLAVLCRILGMQGFIGTFGHVSIRAPETDIVLVSPGAGAEKTTARADQIFVYNLTGKLLHHPGGNGIAEPMDTRFHTRIHRDRPEIMCVAHLHAPNSTLLGIVNRPIVPVFSQAFYLHNGIPTWDNPRLVLSDQSAGHLSQTLGDKIACQMRGHGSVVVGETAEAALWNCIAIEENARYQIAAEPFGGPVPFPSDVVEGAARERGSKNSLREQLVWTYFERRVVMAGLPV